MKGIGASPGYAIGRVFIKKVFRDPELSYTKDKDEELKRLNDANVTVLAKLEKLEKVTTEKIGDAEGQIFKAHQMMLQDPELQGQIKKLIESESYISEYAVLCVRNQMVSLFEAMDNAYMKERAADIKDVCNSLMKVLMNLESIDYDTLDDNVIIIANDLTPSETAQIPLDKVSGFITEIGGETSHTAIMSRTLEIPAVVGASGMMSAVNQGDLIAFDGKSGEIVLEPSEEVIQSFMVLKDKAKAKKEMLKSMIGKKTISKDGFEVSLGCNIGHPDDLKYVIENDGEGIGLFRSEFLYMNRDSMPTEEEQYQAYKTVLEAMDDKPVVIRTLDVGGDKKLSYLEFPHEENPFLGYRAIRYCLDNKEVFDVQLRALIRASVHGNLHIMFPMISNIDEVRKAKKLIEEIKADLLEEDIAFNDFQIGIMIEIPAAALISDYLAKEVDFFSIGTNDLIQYTTAVDRMNEQISDLYSPYHPALLRLIKMIIDNGHKENIWVGMCGEVAGNKELIPLLFAMGLDELSMSPSLILENRQLIATLEKDDAFVSEVLMSENSEMVQKKLALKN
ncbi:MAG: phosphoenolpyruvate--protein phosphotransferase [Clostridiales bacterium]|nr:phosphoenolpyruvate--protein phosphotransferase [Clostridiales bacterium]